MKTLQELQAEKSRLDREREDLAYQLAALKARNAAVDARVDRRYQADIDHSRLMLFIFGLGGFLGMALGGILVWLE